MSSVTISVKPITRLSGTFSAHFSCTEFTWTILLTLQRIVLFANRRREKRLVAKRVMQLVQGQDPPGRFLFRQGNGYRQAGLEAAEKRINALLHRTKKIKTPPKHNLFHYDQEDVNPVVVPATTDVLFVQGTGVAAWPGNVKFGEICRDFCQRYHKTNRCVLLVDLTCERCFSHFLIVLRVQIGEAKYRPTSVAFGAITRSTGTLLSPRWQRIQRRL